VGQLLGSKALTLWIADGANFPGQQHLARAFERYLESAAQIYAGLPADWRLLIEHKMYEPAFYATVIQDWGSSLVAAQTLGPKAFCLVDLGHHAPNVNIELIVARLIHAQRLGGFHFNDSKYGDDDLDAGSIDPYRLFLVFNELVDAEWRQAPQFRPAHMLDQSHNVTDPIESLMSSAIEVKRAYAQALLVDRAALGALQDANDVLLASQTLKRAFTTDVAPILARARELRGGAIDPVTAYRASGYRAECARLRPTSRSGGSGIV
jgi:L-rhamnose isomerase/sugar isomerase